MSAAIEGALRAVELFRRSPSYRALVRLKTEIEGETNPAELLGRLRDLNSLAGFLGSQEVWLCHDAEHQVCEVPADVRYCSDPTCRIEGTPALSLQALLSAGGAS